MWISRETMVGKSLRPLRSCGLMVLKLLETDLGQILAWNNTAGVQGALWKNLQAPSLSTTWLEDTRVKKRAADWAWEKIRRDGTLVLH